jgi:hypothetical protein
MKFLRFITLMDNIWKKVKSQKYESQIYSIFFKWVRITNNNNHS